MKARDRAGRPPVRRVAAFLGIEGQDHRGGRRQHHRHHHARPHDEDGDRRRQGPGGIERHREPDRRVGHVSRHPDDERPARHEDEPQGRQDFSVTKKPADKRVHRRSFPDDWDCFDYSNGSYGKQARTGGIAPRRPARRDRIDDSAGSIRPLNKYLDNQGSHCAPRYARCVGRTVPPTGRVFRRLRKRSLSTSRHEVQSSRDNGRDLPNMPPVADSLPLGRIVTALRGA